MQTPQKNDSEKFSAQKMESIVARLKREGRMPTPEKLDAALKQFRKEYRDEVRQARAKK
jgi:hypothetical protein